MDSRIGIQYFCIELQDFRVVIQYSRIDLQDSRFD